MTNRCVEYGHDTAIPDAAEELSVLG